MPVASILAELTDALTTAVGDYGLYAVFVLMFVDAIFPAASEPVMVFGGALASGAFVSEVTFFGLDLPDGFWSWFAIGLAGTVGYVLGSILGWWIGYRGGHAFVERHGRWVHVTPEKLERAERSFERWGDWFVAFGRVTPVLRSFVAIPAGVLEMPLRRYTILTIPGSAVWCFGLAGIGWALGASWERFHHAFHYVDYAVLGLILIAAVVLGLRWRSSRLARRAAADSAR
jgi:membrane protein DedA with SNARE-associated domain